MNKKIAIPNLGTATQNEKCVAVFATQKNALFRTLDGSVVTGEQQWTQILNAFGKTIFADGGGRYDI